MKYQEIETILRSAGCDPRLVRVIQHLHAENVGLKQEISGICKGLDKMIETINGIAVVAGAHQQLFTYMENGKSMSEAIAALRAEHLSGVESEEIKQ